MRKDVRIGAIIGGILIAVLVVYAIISSTTHKTAKVVIDGGKPSPAGAPSGGASAAPVPDTALSSRDDHSEVVPTPTHDSTTDTPGNSATPAPGGVAVTPIPGVSPATPTVGDHPAATPGPDPAAARSATNWAALLSADHVDAEFEPVKTRTPDPAGLAPDPVTPVVDVPPAQVADAKTTGSGSTGSSGSDSAAGSDAKPTPPTVAAQTHKIQAGETFSSIARAVYGDAKYFKEIAKANPSVDAGRLRPGLVITLPDSSTFKHDSKPAEKDGSAAAARHSAAQPVDPKTEYRVQSTDSLYKISMKLYHSPNKVDAIYQLNKEAIGSDPAKLKLNMVLKLPEPPTETASSR